jgi:hypothetical protein
VEDDAGESTERLSAAVSSGDATSICVENSKWSFTLIRRGVDISHSIRFSATIRNGGTM